MTTSKLPELVRNNKRLIKLCSRLEKMNPSNYEIIPDQKLLECNNDANTHYMVKSLVWCIRMIKSGRESSKPPNTEEKYIMCILHENDYVNKEMLLAILSSCNWCINDTTKIKKIQLANPSIAEYQTGFKIGTIPPIGHDVGMSIFIDERLSLSKNKRFIVGCGVHGYHLILSLDDIIKYAKASTLNHYIRPLVLRSSTQKHCTALISASESNDSKRQKSADEGNVRIKNTHVIDKSDNETNIDNHNHSLENPSVGATTSSDNTVMKKDNEESLEDVFKKRRRIEKEESVS